MKKIVKILLIALCVSPVVMAQSYDDLYYNPDKKKDTPVRKEEKKNVTERKRTYISTNMPVVVKDRKGNVRDIDEYNRRYDAKENDFNVTNDTLVVEEKLNPERGEWVNGFNGTQDDYEYAQRIIRFRNPRFAVSISSPYYWDVVYGLNSWDWNIYVDDFYAYAFPTFTNRLWWDWRFNSYGMGWGSSWGYPYYGGYYGGYGSWGGYYGGYPYYGYGLYGGYYGGGYGGQWAGRGGYYNTRRSEFGSDRSRTTTIDRRSSSYSRSGSMQDRSSIGRRSSSSRVVGTRSTDDYSGVSRRSGYIRSESGSFDRGEGPSRRSTYTRPSSTRTYSAGSEGVDRRGSSYSRPESTPTRSGSYNRGTSSGTRSNSGSEGQSRRSTYDNNSSSSRSYTPSDNSSSRSSYSGGGSSRSGGGSSSSGGSSRSGGGRR